MGRRKIEIQPITVRTFQVRVSPTPAPPILQTQPAVSTLFNSPVFILFFGILSTNVIAVSHSPRRAAFKPFRRYFCANVLASKCYNYPSPSDIFSPLTQMFLSPSTLARTAQEWAVQKGIRAGRVVLSRRRGHHFW